MPAKAPSGPSVTLRKSASLPTQQNTISAPFAASRGVAALAWAPWVLGAPPNSASQACALAGLRL